MDPLTASMIMGGTGIAAQMFGQHTANQTNVNIANATNAFSAAEADKNRDFQAAMSNTAVQRARADMEAAGINPILAAGSPASTPSGGSATGQMTRVENVAQAMGGLGGLVTSALEAQNMYQGLEKQKAEITNINASTKKLGVDTQVARKGIPKAEVTNDAYDLIRPFVKKAKEAVQKWTAPKPKTKGHFGSSLRNP